MLLTMFVYYYLWQKGLSKGGRIGLLIKKDAPNIFLLSWPVVTYQRIQVLLKHDHMEGKGTWKRSDHHM